MPKHRRTRPAFDRPQRSSDVLREIRKRARRGQSLASGANRGDWLYAAALRFFGNWGAAVEAAGFNYGDAREKGLGRDDVLGRIRAMATRGKLLGGPGVPSVLRYASIRLFGSWANAVRAVGLEPAARARKWTPETVVARIRKGVQRGQPMNSVAVIRREQSLYGAGRNVFGSWAAALAAAGFASAAAPRRGKRS
jgi:hypothetical protein